MTKTALAAISLAVLIGLVIFLVIYFGDDTPAPNSAIPAANTTVNKNFNATLDTVPTDTNASDLPLNVNAPANTNTPPAPESSVVLPIKDFYSRVTLKHFGTYITKANSPVQPERFSGYHAGSDAEATSASEKNIDVPIYAAADGKILLRKTVSGYGGVVMVESKVDSETVTFLYGHVRLSSIVKTVGQTVKKGEKLGVLGTGYSSETDNERKHLHFAILKGSSTKLSGYVTSKSALSPWYDPEVWLKERGAQEL